MGIFHHCSFVLIFQQHFQKKGQELVFSVLLHAFRALLCLLKLTRLEPKTSFKPIICLSFNLTDFGLEIYPNDNTYPGADPGFQKGGVDGRPYLLRGGRENALTKKIGNNFTCTCLRRVF